MKVRAVIKLIEADGWRLVHGDPVSAPSTVAAMVVAAPAALTPTVADS